MTLTASIIEANSALVNAYFSMWRQMTPIGACHLENDD
jgi:hypothetical protein